MGLGAMCGEFLQVCLGLGEEGVGLNDGQLKAGTAHQVETEGSARGRRHVGYSE